MPTQSQLETWLEEAYVAKHALATGKRTVSVQYGERRLQFEASGMSALVDHIADLQRQLADLAGTSRQRRIYRVTQTGTGLN